MLYLFEKNKKIFWLSQLLAVMFLCLSIFAAETVQAEEKVVTADGEYAVGPVETLVYAKSQALLNAKRQAVEQASVYLSSLSAVKDLQATKDEITAVTGSFLKLQGEPEYITSTDAQGIYVKAKITAAVDMEEITKNLKSKENLSDYKAEYEKLQADYNRIRKEIAQQNQRYKLAKSMEEKAQVKLIVKKSENEFSAEDWYEKGVHIRYNQPEELKAFTKAIELNPLHVKAYYRRASCYQSAQQYDAAEADLKKAESLALQSPTTDSILYKIYLKLDNLYSTEGQYNSVVEAWSVYISKFPNDCRAYSRRSFEYHHIKKDDLALKDCDTAIRLAKNKDDRKALFCVYLTYSSMGSTAYLRNQYNDALVYTTKAIENNYAEPSDRDYKYFNPHDCYNQRGEIYFALKKYKEAIADYTSAIAIDPKYYSAFENRAKAYAAIGHYEDAIADYTSAIAIDPKDYFAFVDRAKAYAAIGHYEDAIRDFDSAIHLNPKRGHAYYEKAEFYNNIGRKSEAIAAYQDCINHMGADDDYAKWSKSALAKIK